MYYFFYYIFWSNKGNFDVIFGEKKFCNMNFKLFSHLLRYWSFEPFYRRYKLRHIRFRHHFVDLLLSQNFWLKYQTKMTRVRRSEDYISSCTKYSLFFFNLVFWVRITIFDSKVISRMKISNYLLEKLCYLFWIQLFGHLACYWSSIFVWKSQ